MTPCGRSPVNLGADRRPRSEGPCTTRGRDRPGRRLEREIHRVIAYNNTPSKSPPMPFNIDPTLPVPLGIQLRGVIEYGIVCGQLAPGLRLPPVRALASQLGIAPMTVSQVYKELKAVGLLETKPGHGTFAATSVLAQVRPKVLELQARIDSLLHEANSAGLSGADLVALVNARINRRSHAARGLRLVFVGIFEEATRGYGLDIQARLPAGDSIHTTTIGAITGNELARKRARKADLVLTT